MSEDSTTNSNTREPNHNDDCSCGSGHGHGRRRGHGHGHGRGRGGHGFHGRKKILGTTTVGERGQIVIPAEAREALEVNAGDKFVVFGDPHGNSITLLKADVVSRFADIFMNKSEKFEKMAQEIMNGAGLYDDDISSTDEVPSTIDDNPASDL